MREIRSRKRDRKYWWRSIHDSSRSRYPTMDFRSTRGGLESPFRVSWDPASAPLDRFPSLQSLLVPGHGFAYDLPAIGAEDAERNTTLSIWRCSGGCSHEPMTHVHDAPDEQPAFALSATRCRGTSDALLRPLPPAPAPCRHGHRIIVTPAHVTQQPDMLVVHRDEAHQLHMIHTPELLRLIQAPDLIL